jgi:hypothetical protein
MPKKVIATLFFFFLGLLIHTYGQSFYQERVSRNHIFSIGVGPSFAYLDNGGQYGSLNFEIKPSFSAAYSKKLNSRFDLRGTAGAQWISSGGNPPQELMDLWKADKSAFTAVGSIIYMDVMPIINLVAFANHMDRSIVNVYGGVGLGYLTANTKQTLSFSTEEIPTNKSVSTAYIPTRAGLNFAIGPYSDIGIEGSILFTFSDNLDGNIGHNRFDDHFVQGQLLYRRYFIPKKGD